MLTCRVRALPARLLPLAQDEFDGVPLFDELSLAVNGAALPKSRSLQRVAVGAVVAALRRDCLSLLLLPVALERAAEAVRLRGGCKGG